MDETSKILPTAIPDNIKSFFDKIPPTEGKGEVMARIAEAFAAEQKLNQENQKIENGKMYGNMLRAANIKKFKDFKERFKTALENNGGKVSEIKEISEERYLIYFELEGFESPKPFLFDVQKAAYGRDDEKYVELSYFNVPKNMTLEDEYKLYKKLISILKYNPSEKNETTKDPEEDKKNETTKDPENMSEQQLKQEIINLLKGKEYSDLKKFLEGNDEVSLPENESNLAYEHKIKIYGLTLNVWEDGYGKGTIYDIIFESKADCHSLIKLYKLLKSFKEERQLNQLDEKDLEIEINNLIKGEFFVDFKNFMKLKGFDLALSSKIFQFTRYNINIDGLSLTVVEDYDQGRIEYFDIDIEQKRKGDIKEKLIKLCLLLKEYKKYKPEQLKKHQDTLDEV